MYGEKKNVKQVRFYKRAIQKNCEPCDHICTVRVQSMSPPIESPNLFDVLFV